VRSQGGGSRLTSFSAILNILSTSPRLELCQAAQYPGQTIEITSWWFYLGTASANIAQQLKIELWQFKIHELFDKF